MEVVGAKAFLSAFPSARALEARDLRDLLGGMRRVSFIEGERLFEAGDPPGPAYLILTGSVRVERRVDHGRLVLLGRLGPGDLVGDMSLIERSPRAASAVVEAEVVLLRLEAEHFERLRAEAHPAAMWLLGELNRDIALRIRAMVDRLARLREDPSLAAEPPPVAAPDPTWSQRLRAWLSER